jgi:hypothetical protein
MWKRIDKDHWQNSADRHLFWDSDLRCIATEAWTDDGVVMVVIPIDIVREFLKENRYPSFTEAEFLAIGRTFDTRTRAALEIGEEAMEYKARLDASYRKTNSLAQSLMHADSTLKESLKVVELDDHLIQSEVLKRDVAEKKARKETAAKLEILTAAQAEITKLRAEVKRLKEKCGETQV